MSLLDVDSAVHAVQWQVVIQMSRKVLLSHLDRNKPVALPPAPEGGDICFLTKKFLESFDYAKNVRLTITFQRFDSEWKEYVDLDKDEKR